MNSQPVLIEQPVATAPTVVATNQGPAGVTTTTTTQNTLIVNYYGLVPVNAKCPSCQHQVSNILHGLNVLNIRG